MSVFSSYGVGSKHIPLSKGDAATTSPAAASPVISNEVQLEGIEDAILGVTRQHDRLESQVQHLTHEQAKHCHDVSTMYRNITTLLSTSSHLVDSYKSLDEKTQFTIRSELSAQRAALISSQQTQQAEFESVVRRLLENFKDEIVASTSSTLMAVNEVRDEVSDLNRRVVRLEEAQRLVIQEHHSLVDFVRGNGSTSIDSRVHQLDKQLALAMHQLAHLQSTSDTSIGSLQQRLNRETEAREALTRTAVEDLTTMVERQEREQQGDTKRLQEQMESVSRKVSAELQSQSTQIRLDVDHKLALHASDVTSKVTHVTDNLRELERLIMAAQTEISATAGKCDVTAQSLSNQLQQVATRFSDSLENLKATHAEATKKVEADLDKRHKKLVESTHQAMSELVKSPEIAGHTQMLQALQQDLQQVRETLQLHGVAIEAQRMDGNMETAFTELKDWLQDLERRTMGRSEVEEGFAALSSQLSAFKQHTASIEMLLGKRLDAERAARETDVSHQSIQLQKLQSVLKR